MNIESLRLAIEPVTIERGPMRIVLIARTGKMNDRENHKAYNALLAEWHRIDRELQDLLAGIDRDLREAAELAAPPEDAWQIFRAEAPGCLELVDSADIENQQAGGNLLREIVRVLLKQSRIPTEDELNTRIAEVQAKVEAATSKVEELNLEMAGNHAQRLLFLVDSWDLTEGPDETVWPYTEDNLLTFQHTGLLAEMIQAVEAKVFA
jgi:hypothetical protein